jgi:peptide deformylase
MSSVKKITKDDIITLPNPHLRQRSKKIGLITAQVKQLIADMETAVHDWDDSRPHEVTVALAAIQIDQPYRVVIVRKSFDAKDPADYYALINPQITKYEGEIVRDYEGCLSIKSVYGHVPRYSKVRVRALNLAGKEVKYKAEGFLARVLQHEIDHTNGTVFVDHLKDDPEAFFALNNEGKLEALDYDKDVKNSRILW